jgi:hypothetical protein
MAAVGLLALIDDIATLLDDVAVLSKITVKKTSTVLADDLAVNANQLTGVSADRELAIVWAVAKGSAKNKLILVPGALLLSFFAPWLITPMLIIGGSYLCYEGFEKIAHVCLHRFNAKDTPHDVHRIMQDVTIDAVAFEREKIKGAIRTDFILSLEIVVIALGIVKEASIASQILVVSLIAAMITVGVYGVVAAIVKLDDLGLHLIKDKADRPRSSVSKALGRAILAACPGLMKTLSVVGTVAMLLVGGGILIHNIESLHHLNQEALHWLEVSAFAWLPLSIASQVIVFASGILLGAVAVLMLAIVKKLRAVVAGN